MKFWHFLNWGQKKRSNNYTKIGSNSRVNGSDWQFLLNKGAYERMVRMGGAVHHDNINLNDYFDELQLEAIELIHHSKW